jgi:hypothetical protein
MKKTMIQLWLGRRAPDNGESLTRKTDSFGIVMFRLSPSIELARVFFSCYELL